MIELRENQIVQTYDGKSYILKHILTRERGILAINEEGYEFFIRFCDFNVILDPNTEEGGK